MADVFISYARSDSEVARRLANALEARGLSVWIDNQISGGAQFSEVIEREIGAASKVIVLWSAEAVKSEWVRDEASIAKEEGKLLPVSIDGSKPPIGFRQTQTIGLEAWVRGKKKGLPNALASALSLPAQRADGAAQSHGARKSGRRALGPALAVGVLLVLAAAFYLAFGQARDGASGEPGSIAVLVRPFEAEAGATANDIALADGITDELVIRLQSIPQLRIAVAGPEGQAGGDFDAQYIVAGKMRTQDETLRLTANLSEPDGEILWSGNFNRKLADIFYVQESLAYEISDVLRVSFNVDDWASNGGTRNPEAYAAFMQFNRHAVDSDNSVAMASLRRALELDPNFDAAQGEMLFAQAVALVVQPFESKESADRALAELQAVSKRAVAANSDFWGSHAQRVIARVAEKDFVGAAHELDKVRELSPAGRPLRWNAPTIFYLATGSVESAGKLVKEWEIATPGLVNEPYTVFMLEMLGEHEAAIERFKRIESLGTGNLQSMAMQVVLAHWRLGQKDEAFALARKYDLAYARDLAAGAKGSPLAGKTLPELRQWATDSFGYGGQFMVMRQATIEAANGRNDLAVKLMRVGLERPGGQTIFFIWHPIMDDARDQPEFWKLPVDFGMAKMWRETGDWGDFCEPAGPVAVKCH